MNWNPWDRSPEKEAEYETYDKVAGGCFIVLFWAIMAALVFRMSTGGMGLGELQPAKTIEEVMPSGSTPIPERDAGPVVTTTLLPAPTTTSTTTTTTTIPPTTTTTSKPWQPSDECAKVTGHTVMVMRWCPQVAVAIQLHSETIRPWQPGDLQWIQNIMSCESGGDPTADNPDSTAAGLLQGLEFYEGKPLHQQRSLRYHGEESDIYDPGPHIIIYVGLFMDKGHTHWPRCGLLRP